MPLSKDAERPDGEIWQMKMSISLVHSIRGMLDFAVAMCPAGRLAGFTEVRNQFNDLIIEAENDGS